MSFVRRFTSVPSVDVLSQIEGINVLDLSPPGVPQGISTGVVCLVGEFDDMTTTISVDSSGNITNTPVPTEVFSSADLLTRYGGFDSTLGAFGAGCGNGFVELRNKSFGRLVIVPVFLCSAAGIRMWRNLPTNTSATAPTPVVPVQAAVVPAGYALTDAAHTLERMRTAQAVYFTSQVAYASGTDGSVTTSASAATQPFTSASSKFTSVLRPDGKVGVQIGDIIVLGVVGASAPQGTDAGQFRVTAITSDTALVLQAMNGANFAFTTTSAVLAWRLHPASAADSFGDGVNSAFSNQGSFTVAVRPITNDAGTGSSGTNGTWAISTVLQPVVAPPALSGTTADPLSGLAGQVGPTTVIAYTATVQAPNAANNAAIDVLYQAALAGLLIDSPPTTDVNHVWCARKSSTIRSSLLSHCQTASSRGVGRTCSISPELNQAQATVITTVLSNTDPGVGANRDERTFYSWPPVRTLIPEAVNLPIAGADGTLITDGTLDVTGDGWVSSLMGKLAPERNPGEVSQQTRQILQPILGYGRAVPISLLDINVFSAMRAAGIAGLRLDKTTGPEIQSGVTTSLVIGQKNINRRKMADYIEDSLAVIAKGYSKNPATIDLFDSFIGQCTDFLELLLSVDQPSLQRISGYSLDPISGNTPALNAKGIFVLIVNVRTLATMDFIVVQANIGENVNVIGANPVSQAGL